MIALAIRHPVLTLIGVWLVNGAVRGLVSSATGYDALALTLDALSAKNKVQAAKDKTKDKVTP